MDDHDRAWRAFALAQAAVTQQVRADLASFTDLTIGEVDVLDRLLRHDGIRMAELADQVLTSRSGLTRRVDRLERKGLVVRSAVAEDGRGAHAALTRHGEEVARLVVPRYWESIAQHFGARLEPDTECMVDVLERFAEPSP